MKVDASLGSQPLNILIIDDDPCYSRVFKACIEAQFEVHVDHFESLEELGSVGSMQKYDLVVLDYELTEMTGFEIAEYLDAFFPGKPAVLISAKSRIQVPTNGIPHSVKGLISKCEGAKAIVDEVRSLLDEPRIFG